jgi:hypothetical protein
VDWWIGGLELSFWLIRFFGAVNILDLSAMGEEQADEVGPPPW